MTTPLRALIVDDEPLALSILRAKLGKVPDVEIIAECHNGRQAIEATMDHSPDVIFLDIQMPGLNGFDVIKRLQSDVMPLIVFTTAFEQYALDAFNVHAVDYILKPIDQQLVDRAVQRVRQRLEVDEPGHSKPRIMSALNTMRNYDGQYDNSSVEPQENLERKIVIRDRDEITLLKQSDIAWVDAAGDYCCLHADGETHIKRTTLKDLLEELDPEIFKRVHRSTIVNLNFIDKVIPHTKGEFFLQLGEFDRIKVSRNYKDAIRTFLAG